MKLRISRSLLIASCSGLLFLLAAAFCTTRWADLIEVRQQMPRNISFGPPRKGVESLELPLSGLSPSLATIPPLLQRPQQERSPLKLIRKGNLLVLEPMPLDNLEELVEIWNNLPAPLSELHLEERREGGYSLQLKLVSPS